MCFDPKDKIRCPETSRSDSLSAACQVTRPTSWPCQTHPSAAHNGPSCVVLTNTTETPIQINNDNQLMENKDARSCSRRMVKMTGPGSLPPGASLWK